MSKADIASGIASSPILLASAHIAKAMREAREIMDKESKAEAFSRMLGKVMDLQKDG